MLYSWVISRAVFGDCTRDDNDAAAAAAAVHRSSFFFFVGFVYCPLDSLISKTEASNLLLQAVPCVVVVTTPKLLRQPD